MPKDALNAPDEDENQMGGEPEEESGAGYGNHAVPDVAEEPSGPGKDAR